MQRTCFLLLVLLASSLAAKAQEDCSKCDCLHAPVKKDCEKCCHVSIGTIVSVQKDKFVLKTKDASGTEMEKTFSLDDKTKKFGDVKPGDDATVYFHKGIGEKNSATAVKTTPPQKTKPIAKENKPN